MSEITDLFDSAFRPLGKAITKWIEEMPPNQLRMAEAKIRETESETRNEE